MLYTVSCLEAARTAQYDWAGVCYNWQLSGDVLVFSHCCFCCDMECDSVCAVGPFSSGEMAEWFSAGYFSMNLVVKQGADECFVPLGEFSSVDPLRGNLV